MFRKQKTIRPVRIGFLKFDWLCPIRPGVQRLAAGHVKNQIQLGEPNEIRL